MTLTAIVKSVRKYRRTHGFRPISCYLSENDYRCVRDAFEASEMPNELLGIVFHSWGVPGGVGLV